MAELQHTSLISDANLLSYYRFSNGALLTDSVGGRSLAQNGTVNNTGAGSYGSGADMGSKAGCLSQSTQLFNVNNSDTAFSLVCWIYPTSAASLLRFLNISNQNPQVYTQFGYDGSGNWIFNRVKNGIGTQGVTYAGTPAVNQWQHVAMTYDLTNVKGYINGKLVGSVAASGHGNTSPSTTGYGIGSDGNSLTTPNFAGKIDDAAIFSRALSAQEILLLATNLGGAFFFHF